MASNQKLRGIAAGIFLATSAFSATYYLSSPQNTEEQARAISEEEAMAILEESYVILADDEYNDMTDELSSLRVENDELVETQDDRDESDNEQEENEESSDESNEGDIIYQTIITVQQGMTSGDIGSQLERLNIIDNARDFETAVSDMGVEMQIQLGETRVSSDMSIEEMVEAITSQ
ncbi:hypothetical protein [Evansella halocellulosilytica]|uniref:hypothetical protein n=1 Tax=Evansella halocellulosilytica TaxID=2011013 RepID=UPI000BB96AEF|nr:hypothetical protein [Evansella halocellulosilytica]